MKKTNNDKIRKDFRNFLTLTWKFLGLPNPTPIQYDIAQFIQGSGDRVMVQAFRGVGKTYITAAYVMYELWKNPDLKIMIVSATEGFAGQITTFCHQLMDMPLLRDLRPRPDQRNSKLIFDVAKAAPSKDPSVTAKGIGGQITGTRADLVIADDVESENNSDTQVAREKLRQSCLQFNYILKPEGRILYLGTPQTEDTVYKNLEEHGFRIAKWPAHVPVHMHKYDSKFTDYMVKYCKDHKENDPTDPQRFSAELLLGRKVGTTAAGYALQYMLDTELSDLEKFPLRVSDLVVCDLSDPHVGPEKVIWAKDRSLIIEDLPNVSLGDHKYYSPWKTVGDWISWDGVVMSIDPAGRGKDETAYAVVAKIHSTLFLLCAGGLKGGYEKPVLEKLSKVAKKYRVNNVLIESNFGGGTYTELFTNTLLNIYRCNVEEVRSTIRKEKRIIETLEPVVAQHRLVVNKEVIESDYYDNPGHDASLWPLYRLMYQFSRVHDKKGALAHDDRLDALAMAVQYWSDALVADEDKLMAQRRSEDLAKWMDEFREGPGSIGGPKTESDRFKQLGNQNNFFNDGY